MTAHAAVHELQFDGSVLRRGFWLYVWEVIPVGQAPVYYVERTGDSSSTNAQSPFNRMGQHLGFAKNSNIASSAKKKNNQRRSPFAKATGDTLRGENLVACHPKREARRVARPRGVEPLLQD